MILDFDASEQRVHGLRQGRFSTAAMQTGGGFCRWGMLRWCERHRLTDVVVLVKIPRLVPEVCGSMQVASERFICKG